LPRQLGDWVSAGEDLNGELLSLVRPEPLGRPGDEIGDGTGSEGLAMSFSWGGESPGG
jgi:hypothetical protein